VTPKKLAVEKPRRALLTSGSRHSNGYDPTRIAGWYDGISDYCSNHRHRDNLDSGAIAYDSSDCPILQLPKSTRSRPDARDIEIRRADRNDMAAEVFDAFMIDTAGVEYAPDKNLRDHDH
jgi:hypothetical protein